MVELLTAWLPGDGSGGPLSDGDLRRKGAAPVWAGSSWVGGRGEGPLPAASVALVGSSAAPSDVFLLSAILGAEVTDRAV